jgi:hypothetical protein
MQILVEFNSAHPLQFFSTVAWVEVRFALEDFDPCRPRRNDNRADRGASLLLELTDWTPCVRTPPSWRPILLREGGFCSC